MIFDAILYRDLSLRNAPSSNALRAFVRFIEKKLRVSVMVGSRQIPYERPDLIEPIQIAQALYKSRVIESFYPVNILPDEPPLRDWGCRYFGGIEGESSAGGTSTIDDKSALFAALAEGLERYLWHAQTDYFPYPKTCTVEEIAKYGAYISPENFCAFSAEQRGRSERGRLTKGTSYLWIKSRSMVSNKNVYVPAQIVSASVKTHGKDHAEPLIRQQTTTGLATWPTLSGARLSGALEVIERDAFMIMWFNQLTLPRIELVSVRGKSSSLDKLIDSCQKYRLKIHIVPMLTDAPTHAICVVIEDMSGHAPRFTMGLRANQSLLFCIEKATTEALRARVSYRNNILTNKSWNINTPVEKIGHKDRIYYWGVPENAKHLEFLTQGKEIPYEPALWENDTLQEHLGRILAWCKENNYECLSVSLGKSKANPTPWFVEMVVLPDLQPIHLHEWLRHLGGKRLTSIPKLFGYTPRENPFIDRPHPFV